ncbi:MAG TPA: DUF4340 domain-containing protein, partial [Alkalispirochaeta sp.]|nr:DUF4340 domain-containing protein [Alkalispirochaeta sp.]
MKGVRIPRTTRAYLIVIVVLSGVFAAQEMRTPHRNAIPIPDIAAEVDRIVMEEDASDGEPARVAIYREQDTWRIRANEDAPRSYRADSTTIESLLQNLAELSAVDVISTRANYEEYGLTAGETRRLRFFVGDTEPVALQFGATAAAGESVYARINGSREIVLVPRSLARAVTTDLDQLRDTAVVRLPEEQITQVEIRSREHETLTVSRQRPGDSSAAAAGEG